MDFDFLGYQSILRSFRDNKRNSGAAPLLAADLQLPSKHPLPFSHGCQSHGSFAPSQAASPILGLFRSSAQEPGQQAVTFNFALFHNS